jgi:hypothetical protein
MTITAHGKCHVTLRSAGQKESTVFLGNVARNGTIVGEVVSNGVGNGHFKLYPEQVGHGGDLTASEALVAPDPKLAADLPSECSICLQHFSAGELILRTSCSGKGHVFHKCCLEQWSRSHSSCPLCRQSLVQGAREDVSEVRQP